MVADVDAPGAGDIAQVARRLSGQHDVFGDGSVVLLPTPGHTAGHQSLWVRAGSTQFLLTGDACYTREHLDQTIIPMGTHHEAQMAQSMAALRELRDRKGVTLLYGHDAEQWSALPKGRNSVL